MKLRFNHLTCSGFRSFVQPMHVDLDGAPALVLVSGENRFQPGLGSNGAGKSTIWDALVWTLYGRTTRGLRAGTLLSWNSSQRGYSATVEFNDHKLHRSWRPNAIRLDDKEVTQDQVVDVLGIDFAEFLQGVVLGQFAPKLLDLPRPARAALLSEALRLSQWDEYASSSADRLRVLRAKVVSVDNHMSRLEGRIAEMTDSGANSHELTRLYKRRRRSLRSALRKHESALEAAEVRMYDAGTKLELSERKVEAIDKQITIVEAECDKLSEEKASSAAARKLHEKQLNDMKSVAKGKCPVCKQRVTQSHAHKERQRISALLERAALAHEQSADMLSRSVLKLKRLRAKRNDLNPAGHRVELRSAERDMDACRDGIRSTKLEIKQLDRSHEKVVDETVRRQQRRSRAIRERALCRVISGDLHAAEDAHKFWAQRGFKEAQLLVMEHALQELEAAINITLVGLGLEGWRVECAVERETKSGTMQLGLHVGVYSPRNDELVPWEVWSGGETSRLRIAASLGFIDMLLGRSGVSCNLEVWDEPSTWLPPDGVDMLLDVLRERAHGTDKRVYLVDHRNLEQHGGFDEMLHVVMDEKGMSHVQA